MPNQLAIPRRARAAMIDQSAFLRPALAHRLTPAWRNGLRANCRIWSATMSPGRQHGRHRDKQPIDKVGISA